jgi:hypothetical protein
MGLGISGYIEIERIFIRIYNENHELIDKGHLDPEIGHKFLKKVVGEGKIGWEYIMDRFPKYAEDMKQQKIPIKLIFLGPNGSGTRKGAHPAYFRSQIAGRTILYQGEFYDLPEMRKR